MCEKHNKLQAFALHQEMYWLNKKIAILIIFDIISVCTISTGCTAPQNIFTLVI
jgi:hypothetical protein